MVASEKSPWLLATNQHNWDQALYSCNVAAHDMQYLGWHSITLVCSLPERLMSEKGNLKQVLCPARTVIR